MVLEEDRLHATIPTWHCCAPVLVSCGDAVLQDTVPAWLWGAVLHLCPFHLTVSLRSAWSSQPGPVNSAVNQLSFLTVVCRARVREAVFWKMQIWNLKKARAVFLRTQRHPAYRRKQIGWALKKKRPCWMTHGRYLTTMLIKPIKFLSPFINRQAKNRLAPLESLLVPKLRNTAF